MNTKKKLLFFAGGVSIAAISSGVTYLVAKKQWDATYEERVNAEVENSIDFLVKMKLEEIMSIGEALDDIGGTIVVTADELDRIEAEPEEVIEAEPLPPVDGERVFADKPPIDSLSANQKVAYNKVMTDHEYAAIELPEEPPYEDENISVISKEIFEENGTGWEQQMLTYFADKGVLDAQGDFVDDPLDKIGPLDPPFGQLSNDPQIVYLRNKKLEVEYQLISDPGNASDFANPMSESPEGDTLQHSLEDLRMMYDSRRSP